MKKILCYGDSNTWGHDPADASRLKKRWPVILQEILPQYKIIEDGLCGRTTRYDLPDSNMFGRNGLEAFRKSYLEQLCAVDIIIIMLGTNDVLNYFEYTPEKYEESLRIYIREIRMAYQSRMPEILLIAPAEITENALKHPDFKNLYSYNSVKYSKGFADVVKKVSEDERVYYMNAADIVCASQKDGIHLEESEHRKLAYAVSDKIAEIFK